jgi:hypothetical protein
MRDLNKQERTAIETVARRFSATWEKGSDPPDAYIIVAGKRVAIDITTLKWRGTLTVNAAKPRLRFDKVATRLIERLQATLGQTVPDGTLFDRRVLGNLLLEFVLVTDLIDHACIWSENAVETYQQCCSVPSDGG